MTGHTEGRVSLREILDTAHYNAKHGNVGGWHPDSWMDEQVRALARERDELVDALRALVFAASARENVMGDPCGLLQARADLRAEIGRVQSVLARHRAGGGA